MPIKSPGHRTLIFARRCPRAVSLALLWLLLAPLAVNAAPLPHVGPLGQRAFQDYLQAGPHRAFVIAPGGTWFWQADMPSEDYALETALAACRERTEQQCVPYALNEQVIFNERQWPALWGPYLNTAEAAQAAPGVRRGQRMFDFMLKDASGKTLTLAALRGKTVLLHFWASWCTTCRGELPQFVRLRERLRARPDIVFVFTQLREEAALARDWLTRERLDLPFYDSGASETVRWLAGADGSRIADRTVAPVFPTTYVLDRHGIVVFAHRGAIHDWTEYEGFLHDVAARSGQ